MVVGTKPELDWVGENNTLVVKFSAAENHNVNKGKRDNPLWETIATSWFNMEAWGDVAKAIMEEKLDVGDAFSFEGFHKIDKVQNKNEKPRYYSKYKILNFEVYERKDREEG